ncbi:MAG: hypothetical protein ACRELY_20690 [Polyangiaceae bacterium]
MGTLGILLIGGCANGQAGSSFDSSGEASDAGGATSPADAGAIAYDAGVKPAPGFSSDASADAAPASCDPCSVSGPGTYCGIDVAIDPYVTGGPFGGFQSVAGTGYQDPITITLSQPITWASIDILDPDYPDFIQVYDASGTMIGQTQFVDDGTPNVLTDSTMGLGGGLIKTIKLVPDSRDYVAYDDLTIVPAGCAPPPPR